MAVHHHGRRARANVKEPVRYGPESRPQGHGKDERADEDSRGLARMLPNEAKKVAYLFTSIVDVAVRPQTSGVYISSARAGAVRNVPAVVARTM
jgi:hypothetical protein